MRRGLLLMIGLFLLMPAVSEAAPSVFTGTFSITLEGYTASAVFNSTADVGVGNGAITFTNPMTPSTQVLLLTVAPMTVPNPIFSSASLIFAGFADGGVVFTPGGGGAGGFGGNGAVNAAGNPTGSAGLSAHGVVGSNSYFGLVFARSVIGVGGATGVGSTARLGPSTTFIPNSLVGAPWTTGVTNFTINGRNYTFSGTDARTTTSFGGNIVLVTPIRVNGALGGYGGFAQLNLTFAPVPEPSTSLLMGSGLLGLAILGSRRRKV